MGSGDLDAFRACTALYPEASIGEARLSGRMGGSSHLARRHRSSPMTAISRADDCASKLIAQAGSVGGYPNDWFAAVQ